jgi:hypothetical protein
MLELSLISWEATPRLAVVQLRAKSIVSVVFGFGDASGTELGSTFTCGRGFSFRIGVWGSLEKDESSNWKEFSNVVESLEEEADLGNLQHSEVFMFTDNATVEACSYKGSSSSPKLLSLIIRLLAMSTRHGIKLHIFHVAGTRMIAQGTDGVSRGCLDQGVMGGEEMVSFIPIHKSATERSDGLLPWIRSWCGQSSIALSEADWFDVGHDINGWHRHHQSDLMERPKLEEGRTYIWSPSPFAADVAIAELRKARIKRQTSSHVFVCPRLCCSLWLKQIYRACDLVFQVLPNSPFWPPSAHEPLLIGLIFPFTRANPWQLRGTPKLLAVGRELRNLQENQEMDRRDLLRKLWSRCNGLRNVPEHVVWRLLYFSPLPDFHIVMASEATGERGDEDRIESGWTSRKSEERKFVSARDGEDLLVPFECDSCIYSKLYRVRLNSETLDEAQRFGLACIRRVNLDAF